MPRLRQGVNEHLLTTTRFASRGRRGQPRVTTSRPQVSWVVLRRAKRKMLAMATVLIVPPLRQCAVRLTREHLTSGTQAPGLLDVVRGWRDARECPPVVLSQALASLDKEVTFSTRSLSD